MREKERFPVVFESPFALMRRLSSNMERVFDDFEVRHPFLLAPEGRPFDWIPPVDVYQKDQQFIVRAELPGLEKEDVKIEVMEKYLTITGERKYEKEEKREGFVRAERSYGTFFRSIPLPEGAVADKAKAMFKKGVLEIEVPIAVKKPIEGRRLPIEEPAEKPEKELLGV